MIILDMSPDGATIALAANVNTFKSSLNGFEQHSILPGSRWAASFTWSNRKGVEARKLRAQLAALLGPVGVFKIRIPEPNYGTALGAGVVIAGDAGESEITTSGWTPSQTSLLAIGDWIEVNQQAFQVTAQAASDGAGLATIQIAPPIRKKLSAGQSINAADPSFYMRMTDPSGASAALSPAVVSPIYAASIDAVEID